MEAPATRLIIAMTGATGTVYGIRLLEMLREAQVETHLVMSRWAVRTLIHESAYSKQQVEALASAVYHPSDLGAAISSGSFHTDGMIVAPCSARSLAAIATGVGDNLIHRAADVIIKEQRKLLLAIRETPLSAIHLDNALKLARLGVIIAPPMPAFYNKPADINAMVDYSCVRILDHFGIHLPGTRWQGLQE